MLRKGFLASLRSPFFVAGPQQRSGKLRFHNVHGFADAFVEDLENDIKKYCFKMKIKTVQQHSLPNLSMGGHSVCSHKYSFPHRRISYILCQSNFRYALHGLQSLSWRPFGAMIGFGFAYELSSTIFFRCSHN